MASIPSLSGLWWAWGVTACTTRYSCPSRFSTVLAASSFPAASTSSQLLNRSGISSACSSGMSVAAWTYSFTAVCICPDSLASASALSVASCSAVPASVSCTSTVSHSGISSRPIRWYGVPATATPWASASGHSR